MDAVEDIKGRLSIEDVISRYVELKRAGRNFRGLSPFGNEKTPSFMVSPEKQIWHDFSSGKGGNMFSFVMEMEGLDFKGALELLARQAGIDLSQYRGSYDGQRSKQKERMYEALELAAKFYQVHFSKNQGALEYILKKRGFSKDTALQFKIGYAPDGGTALVNFLRGKGFSEDEMKQAGLVTLRYNEARDMFRGRIMIPLMDSVGRVVGFTARILHDDPNAPKYINTPQTLLYDKSRNVFGLNLAKDAIRKNNYAVLVEGNLDVIASHQAGVKQTVATAGTALTEQQLKAIARFTPDVRLAFDQDSAGLQATERSLPIASKVGVNLSIITIPAGKDPDELIKKDPEAWQKIITKPQYAVDWLIERHQKQLDITSAKGKREFSDIVLKVVRALGDSVEQDHYIVQLSKLIGVSPDALRSKLGSGAEVKRVLKYTNKPAEDRSQETIDQTKNQNNLLAIILQQPALREDLAIVKADMLNNETAQKLLQFLQKNPEFNIETDMNKLFKVPAVQGADEHRKGTVQASTESAERNLQRSNAGASASSASGFAAGQARAIEEFVQILLLLYEELYKGLEIMELRYEAARLQARLVEQYVKRKKAELAAAMREADDNKMTALLEQAKKYDALLNSIKKKESTNA
jgi:DNA primase